VTNSPETISDLADELERIQQQLFAIQKVLEKMEQADTLVEQRGEIRKGSLPPQTQMNLSLRKRKL
jgi:hypothetical protein